MQKKISIIGSGGHCSTVIGLLKSNAFCIDGIFDETYALSKSEKIMGFKLIGNLEEDLKSRLIVLAKTDILIRVRLLVIILIVFCHLGLEEI